MFKKGRELIDFFVVVVNVCITNFRDIGYGR